MDILDQICAARAFREYKGNIKSYAAAHEYRSMSEALPSYLVGEKLSNGKYKDFTNEELKELFEAL